MGVSCGIQGSEVSAQAGTDEGHRIAADGAVDDGELAGDGDVLEVTVGEVGNVDGNAGTLQKGTEVPGF
jgi:hypothetical protein